MKFRNRGPNYAFFPNKTLWQQRSRGYWESLFSPANGNSCQMLLIQHEDEEIPDFLNIPKEKQLATKKRKSLIMITNPTCLLHVWTFDFAESMWRNISGVVEHNTLNNISKEENSVICDVPSPGSAVEKKQGIFGGFFAKKSIKKGGSNSILNLRKRNFPSDMEAIGGCVSGDEKSLILLGGKKKSAGLMEPPGFFVFSFTRRKSCPGYKYSPAFADLILICAN